MIELLKKKWGSKLSPADRFLAEIFSARDDDIVSKYCSWHVKKFGDNYEPWYMKPVSDVVFGYKEFKIALVYRRRGQSK